DATAHACISGAVVCGGETARRACGHYDVTRRRAPGSLVRAGHAVVPRPPSADSLHRRTVAAPRVGKEGTVRDTLRLDGSRSHWLRTYGTLTRCCGRACRD